MAVSQTFTVKEMPSVLRRQGEAFKRAVLRGLRNGARAGQVEMAIRIKAVRPFPPINLGNYQRAWKVTPTENGAILHNDSPYAAIIELGRRPGAKPPPISVIQEWVYRKFRVERKWRRTRNAAKANEQRDEIISMAFAIARAIGKRGLKPKRIMMGAMTKLAELADREVRKSLHEAEEGR